MIDQPTTCGFCSCGCALYVEPAEGRVVALCPSATHPVSTGRLCFKGWNATPAVLGAARLRTPLVRKGNTLEPASWAEAIAFTASAVRRASSESGADSIGIIGSAKIANEECYSLVKLARGVIQTPNVDGACRFYDASLIRPLGETVGTAAPRLELNSLTDAGSMLIVGANVMEQLAHVGSRIQDAAENGCKIVVADPRVSRLAPQASLFLHPRPGTDLAWIRALIKTIIDRNLFVKGAAGIPGFEELRESVAGAMTDGAVGSSGVDADSIEQAAAALAEHPPAVVMFGLGVLQQPDSTHLVQALADVAILLGGTVMPLRGQNNAQGACDLGLLHDMLPGYAPLAETAARKRWETLWRCRLPSKPGMNAVDMIRACSSGRIKALLVFGENVALSAPHTKESLDSLGKIDFLAVADLYLTETARLADVVLPACSFLEKDGTFTNIEGRVQRVRKMFEPVGGSKPDLEIIAGLSSALGTVMETDPRSVMAEIAAHVAGYEGVSYETLDETWAPLRVETSARPRLAPIPARPTSEDPEYPFRLIASRINYHQQTGTMAVRTPVLAREYPETFAELNEGDANALGLRPGRTIKISSRSGALLRTLIVSNALPSRCVHVPHFFGGDSPNVLSSYESDPVSGVPAYKACAVKIEAVK